MEVELKVKDGCEIMGFCSRFALSLVEMGPNGHIFSPQTRDVSVSTLNKTYSHTDTQSPHNGFEIPTIFNRQCSQLNQVILRQVLLDLPQKTSSSVSAA